MRDNWLVPGLERQRGKLCIEAPAFIFEKKKENCFALFYGVGYTKEKDYVLSCTAQELCSVLCSSLAGRGVWGRMDTLLVWLSPFSSHLQLSQQC